MTDNLNFDPAVDHLTDPYKCWIGVQLSVSNRQNLAHVFAEKPLSGPVVLKVIPDGPADKAGIKAGDMIVQVDHSPVTSPESFTDACRIARLEKLLSSVSIEKTISFNSR
jgi:S1-C subfamily serine protease